MQAVSAVLNGKYTMQGEQFDTVEVDFGRSAGNNIIQATGKNGQSGTGRQHGRLMIWICTAAGHPVESILP